MAIPGAFGLGAGCRRRGLELRGGSPVGGDLRRANRRRRACHRTGHSLRHHGHPHAPRPWVLGANTPPARDRRAAMGRRGVRRFSCEACGGTPHLSLLHIEPQRGARPLQRSRTAWIHGPLDAQAMRAAAQVLLGEHDFSGLPLHRVPVEDAGTARVTGGRAARRGHAGCWRSRPTPTCITWCATSWARWSRCRRCRIRWTPCSAILDGGRTAPRGDDRTGVGPVPVAGGLPGRVWHTCA